MQILIINRVRVLGKGPHSPANFVWEYPHGMFPAKYVILTTYTNHRLAMCIIKKNNAKKIIFEMEQTVVDYIVYSTSTTT